MDALTTTNATYSLTSSTVRKLTGGAASFEDMVDADYDEIYRRLRKWDERTGKYKVSLYECEQTLKAAYPDAPSRPEISRWERGEIKARPRLRNALRVWDNREPLPPTIPDVVAQYCNPDAPVFLLGAEGVAEAVLLVGSVSDWNIQTYSPACPVDVPARTKAQRTYYRPCLPVELRQQVEASGETVEELIKYALEMKQRGGGYDTRIT